MKRHEGTLGVYFLVLMARREVTVVRTPATAALRRGAFDDGVDILSTAELRTLENGSVVAQRGLMSDR